MKRALFVAGLFLVGFTAAELGVPVEAIAAVGAAAAISFVVGFDAGRSADADQVELVREVYLDFPQRVLKHRDELELAGLHVATSEELARLAIPPSDLKAAR